MIHPVTKEILTLFENNGHSMYGGEAVTQLAHALQAAFHAKIYGASDMLITAALLHDIGHLLHDLPDDASDHGIDDFHEELAAQYLDQHFKDQVVLPVQLHVMAKRYLCTIDENYYDSLSEPSRISLEFQGGKLSDVELNDFVNNSYFEDAILLRRWDDLAKDVDMIYPEISTYIPHIEKSLKLTL